MSAWDTSGSAPQHSHPHNSTMSRNEKICVDQVTVPTPPPTPRGTTRGGERHGGDIVDNHGEPLLMSNQELYSVMVQINWTLKTQALTNMQVHWQPKSEGKWHPFQWEAILHCPTAEGHIAVPSSVSRNGDCLHVWPTGRADLLRLFQRTLFRQTDPVSRDAVRFLYTPLSTPPCERRYA